MEKRGRVENLTYDTPPKKGFWTPPLVTRIAATSNRKSLATAIVTQKSHCDSKTPVKLRFHCDFCGKSLRLRNCDWQSLAICVLRLRGSLRPPPRMARFPPPSGVSALFFLYKNPRQSRPEALLEGSKTFRESAFSGTFSSPILAISAATYRGAECPTLKTAEKQPKRALSGSLSNSRQTAGKTAETPEKQSKQLFFGCFDCFSGCFSAVSQ